MEVSKILPGMFVYADGLISSEIIEGRQISAVVGYVEKSTVLAVCLRRKALPWSSHLLSVGEMKKITNGKEATALILSEARLCGRKADAAQWCYEYAEDGVKKGKAFLATIDEWEKLFIHAAEITASLKALGAAPLNGGYWSSNEDGSSRALRLRDGKRNSYCKSYETSYARPVIRIKL